MLWKTHLAVGMACTLAIFPPKNIWDAVILVSAAAIGSTLPDLDAVNSKSGQTMNRIMASVVGITCAFMFLDYYLGFGILEWLKGISFIASMLPGAIIFVCACAFGRNQPHRSFMHSVLALAILDLSLYCICPSAIKYFSIGFVTHILVDLLNKKRVRLLYPFKVMVGVPLFASDGIANDIIFALGTTTCIVEVLTLTGAKSLLHF